MGDIEQHIRELVAAGLSRLEEPYRGWAEAHLVDPRPVLAKLDVEREATETFWLVTDVTGFEDSGYRVVHDPETAMFGLTTFVRDRGDVFLGLHGDFAQTIVGM